MLLLFRAVRANFGTDLASLTEESAKTPKKTSYYDIISLKIKIETNWAKVSTQNFPLYNFVKMTISLRDGDLGDYSIGN